VFAIAPEVVAEVSPLAEPISLSTREEMETYIIREYPVYAQDMIRVIECESDFNPSIGGDLRENGYTSWGLSQIHLPAHPTVSVKKKLTDPEFAIRFHGRIFCRKDSKRCGRATNERLPVSRGVLCTDVGRKWKWATSYHCMVPVQELGLCNDITSGQDANVRMGTGKGDSP
jgi:hypothetical protein